MVHGPFGDMVTAKGPGFFIVRQINKRFIGSFLICSKKTGSKAIVPLQGKKEEKDADL